MVNPSGETALNLVYMKLLRICLFPFGGWPNFKKNKCKPIFNRYTILLAIQGLAIIGEVIYLHDNLGKHDFKFAAYAFVTLFITILATVRLSLPHFESYFDIFRMFAQEFHLVHFKHKGNSFRKVFLTTEKFSCYFTVFINVIALLGMILFNLTPMYVNIKNGAFNANRYEIKNITLEFTVKYKFPAFTQESNIILSIFINLYLCCINCLSFIAIDLLLILMTFQIIGHLEILAMNMSSMPKPKKEMVVKYRNNWNRIDIYEVTMFDEEENLEIKKLLNEFIQHHILILRFTDKISNIFGPMLGFNYLLNLIAWCLVLLECFNGKPVTMIQYGPITLVIFMQLVQVSIILEIVAHKSHLLSNSVYCLPWECMNTQNRNTVFIMLLRVQKPIQVTAYGVLNVGVKNMSNILKITYSYYTFLRSL